MFIAESVRSENHQEPRPETKCLQCPEIVVTYTGSFQVFLFFFC